MRTDGLKFLLALEPEWTVSVSGREFLSLTSAEIAVDDSTIRFGRYLRKILDLEWLRPNIVRIRTAARLRSGIDLITLYPGQRLPPTADLRRRRREFQTRIGRALSAHFGGCRIEKQMLYSDRRHGIGGAYPRFLVGVQAVVAVDPDESSAVVNGIMRAALMWAPLVRGRLCVLVPRGRHHTIAFRLHRMPWLRQRIQWLQLDGETISMLEDAGAEPETHVQEFSPPDAGAEVARICALAPDLLQAVPYIAGRAVSIRLRGIEIARISSEGTLYPWDEPVSDTIRKLEDARRYGSRHPLARAYEERWLESNLIGQIRQVLPSIDVRHIYPQVPSFVGEERNIIDLLTVTSEGRLVVIEIKASADPDLPFQALDYWIAVERHRKAGDFSRRGYFGGHILKDEPALLILVAPLLSYHKAIDRLLAALPREVPLMEIGINQTWKKEIKILRRRGSSVRLKTEKSK